jgi:hypothetical protein
MTKPRAPQHVINRLKELRAICSMETARFGMPAERVMLTGGAVFRGEEDQMTVDDFIKSRTSPWRQTWILPELDKLINWATGEDAT